MFPSENVRPLFDDVVPVELYTDRDDEENRRNAALRKELTNQVANPVYVMLTPEGEVVDMHLGSTAGPEPFIEWFEQAYEKANNGGLVSSR